MADHRVFHKISQGRWRTCRFWVLAGTGGGENPLNPAARVPLTGLTTDKIWFWLFGVSPKQQLLQGGKWLWGSGILLNVQRFEIPLHPPSGKGWIDFVRGFGVVFLLLKGKGCVVLPWQEGSEEREAGSNPWGEFNSCSKKNSKFSLNPGRTTGNNSDRYEFSSEALSAKLLSFPSYFGDRKVPGGYFQPNMKAPFFQVEKNYLGFFFFPLFLCTAREMCRQLVPVPNLPYLHVFPGGDWLSFPLLHSILAPAQNHYKAWRTKNT